MFIKSFNFRIFVSSLQFMKALRKPTVSFFVAMISIAAILFLIPISLFDGEVLFSHTSTWQPLKLSLSYFIGIGVSQEDLAGVEDFRLVGMGYILAVLLLFAFPLLIAYRVHIANINEARKRAKGKSEK